MMIRSPVIAANGYRFLTMVSDCIKSVQAFTGHRICIVAGHLKYQQHIYGTLQMPTAQCFTTN